MRRRIEIPEPVGSVIALMMIALKSTDDKTKKEISEMLTNTPSGAGR